VLFVVVFIPGKRGIYANRHACQLEYLIFLSNAGAKKDFA